ncbi:Asp23/Gls24 family envelope stress response protein [Actinomadura sp. 9N407]|uniref:Asp23/Gls24 family envelope stress response protein n=1 Tax=Actinomadura sp. 9N407 TaxID=3375154 RepID=UPI0037AA1E6F
MTSASLSPQADLPPTVEPPPRPGRSPDAGDPYRGERGHTKIAEKAVARIVTRAVGETEDAGGLGRKKGQGRAARTDVDVAGTVVTARVRMSVVYPEPVREVSERVREHVRERVEALTGFTVRQVDIEVAELERPPAPRSRRGRRDAPVPHAPHVPRQGGE